MKKRQGRRHRKARPPRGAKPSLCAWCEHRGATIEHVEGDQIYKLHPACRSEMLSWLAHRAAHELSAAQAVKHERHTHTRRILVRNDGGKGTFGSEWRDVTPGH